MQLYDPCQPWLGSMGHKRVLLGYNWGDMGKNNSNPTFLTLPNQFQALKVNLCVNGPLINKVHLIHSLDPDANKLISHSIDISSNPLLKVLSDPVQLLRGGHGVVDQRVHLGLDQAILRNCRIDAVHVTFVCRTARGTTTQSLRHFFCLFKGFSWRIEDFRFIFYLKCWLCTFSSLCYLDDKSLFNESSDSFLNNWNGHDISDILTVLEKNQLKHELQ